MLDFLFSTQGRLSRSRFWLGSLGVLLAMTMAFTLLFLLAARASANHGSLQASGMTLPLVGLGAALVLLGIWANFSMGVKRYHDRGKSGAWVLVQFVPVVGWLWYLVEAGFVRGTYGPNQYGEDPRGGGLDATLSHF